MSFGGLFGLSSVAWLALATLGLAAGAYLIRTRHRRFEVPFASLWQQVLAERDANSLWRKLRRLLSLLLILVILSLLLFAVLDPTLGGTARGQRNVVIVLDASASMQTKDENVAGAPATRFEAAKRRAREFAQSLGGDDQLLVLLAHTQTAPLTRFSADKARVMAMLDPVQPSQAELDLHRALRAARDALAGRPNPMIVLISDGAVTLPRLQTSASSTTATKAGEATPTAANDLDVIDLGAADLRFVPVGAQTANAGIVAFNARRYLRNRAAYEVFVEVANSDQAATTRRLVIYNGNTAVDTREITLAPGERLRQRYPDIPADGDARLRVELQRTSDSAPDALAVDDVAYAVLPPRRTLRLLLVSNANLFLQGAMLAYEVPADELSAEEYARDPSIAERYDAIIFDDYTPPSPPAAHALYFFPDATTGPRPVRQTLSAPRITDVDNEHPVGRFLSLSDANFDSARTFSLLPGQGDAVIARSLQEPIIIAGKSGEHRFVACGFSLRGTDLVLRVAFPQLLMNTLDWLAGESAEQQTTARTGLRQHVALGANVGWSQTTVTPPQGAPLTAPVMDGVLQFYPDVTGYYQVASATGETIELAANLASVFETTVMPTQALAVEGRRLSGPPNLPISASRHLWVALLLVATALLLLEWATYHRRVTV